MPAATRGSPPPDHAPRSELLGPHAFLAARRVGRGLDWTSASVLRAEEFSPLLPVTSRPLAAPFQLVGVVERAARLANLRSVERTGGASGQGAVLSGFLETKIGPVWLPD